MRDFTVTILERLLQTFIQSGYDFITYRQYAQGQTGSGRYVILRHDIDNKAHRAFELAKLEQRLMICGTFYIRQTTSSFNEKIVRDIAAMGHEIGYHYEDFSRNRGNVAKAEKDFACFLEQLRKITSVNTICMHGSPLSRHDNKALWRYCDYKKYGILSELYLDTDFTDMFYLTETGRGWNSRFNIRDRVNSPYSFSVKDTADIIRMLEDDLLPKKIMVTIHPQRWSDHWGEWLVELLSQNTRNMGKMFFLSRQT